MELIFISLSHPFRRLTPDSRINGKPDGIEDCPRAFSSSASIHALLAPLEKKLLEASFEHSGPATLRGSEKMLFGDAAEPERISL